MPASADSTTCVIAGGGPAGMVLGLLLARGGVPVGQVHEMQAALTVACDGRSSTLRSSMSLQPRVFGAPMDVWWFRLPRHEGDPAGLNAVFRSGHGCIVIDRGDYYQIAYVIPKGTDHALRAEGVDALRRQMRRLMPWLADRTGQLASMDDVKLLDVQMNRLRKWYTDGLLLIGDAAHAMSPVSAVSGSISRSPTRSPRQRRWRVRCVRGTSARRRWRACKPGAGRRLC